MCFCVIEPDPVFDSYLQGPLPVANVEQAPNSIKDVVLPSSSGPSSGNRYI